MIEDLPIKEYHERPEISSTTLKTILRSPAHLEFARRYSFKPTKATILGDAFHAFLLQPWRFSAMYECDAEVYQRASGTHLAGDPKLDDEGDFMMQYKHKTDSSLDIKGEEYKKFYEMHQAYNKSEAAQALIKQAKYIECSFFNDGFKVRPDFITDDGYIVDIKTVGGARENPAAPENFCRDFYSMGYDLQMFMYDSVVRQEIPDIKGFKFLVFEAKRPSGVQIYTFVNGESKWFELGGYRFTKAVQALKDYKKTSTHEVYANVYNDDMPLSWEAENELAIERNKNV